MENRLLFRYFVCATVRILSAWLAEETMALREDVCNVLEFVVTLSVETFQAQKVTGFFPQRIANL